MVVTGSEVTLKLEGKLAGPWVDELEQCWKRTTIAHPDSPLQVDLVSVSFVSADGKQLLQKMHGAGTELCGSGAFAKAIVEEITGTAKKSATK